MSLATRVHRITMPRYEVEHADGHAGLSDAAKIRGEGVLVVDHVVPLDVGSEVVVDLAVSGVAFSVSLLFRVLRRPAHATAFEWWARRRTDPDILDLWMEALEVHTGAQAIAAASGLSAGDVKRLLEACRRALSHNPFTALHIHWATGEKDIDAAAARMTSQLEGFSARKGLPPRVAQLLVKALDEVPKARTWLSTLEGRRRARTQFVPIDQIRHARELCESKVEIARGRGDKAEIARAQTELDELWIRPAW